MHAAHDVGRAINPTQVEGQIHGGIAQGLGMALMEEYISGKTDNLHDYLIPTVGDVPPIVVHIVEDAEPLGPYGAKGVGEPALIPTAPAILNAIRHATGVRITHVPATPDRVRKAILEQSQMSGEPDVESATTGAFRGARSHARLLQRRQSELQRLPGAVPDQRGAHRRVRPLRQLRRRADACRPGGAVPEGD